MPEFCTCGAQLPPDARFCHKCGKPQRDEPLIDALQPETPPVVVAPPVVPSPPPPEIGFRNALAIRIALFAALAVFLLMTLSVQVMMNQGIAFLWLGLAGFGAVFLYGRRTGQALSVSSGARLGWLAGLFAFLISLVLLTFVTLALKDPATAETWRQQMSAHGAPDSSTKQMLEALDNPAGLVEILVALFVFFTLLPAAGGALAARLLRRNEHAAPGAK